MFKIRKTGTRRCKESQQMAERGGSKRRKLEGNSNITSNRVTIPPGFLCLGVKSKTIKRNPRAEKENLESHRDCILNENLHGLFKDNTTKKIRKISKTSKSKGLQGDHSTTASEYYFGNLRGQNRQHKSKESPCRKKTITRNNSRSLFREINERCARIKSEDSIDFNYPVIAVLDANCKKERFRPTSFCLNLARDITIDIDQHDYLFNSKLSIRDNIRAINKRLRGEMSSPTSPIKKMNNMEVQREARGIENFQYIPRCDWIFHTPPRQRVVFPRAEGCAIQPAVICTTKKQSNIYELHPNAEVDLSIYSNRQNLPIDSRYLRPLASISENMDTSFNVDDLGAASQAYAADKDSYGFYEKRFKFSEPEATASHPFAHVTSRPSKTVKKLSRVNNFYRRKSEELNTTPIRPSLFQSKMADSQGDITIVENNGRYKIVDKQLPEREDSFSFNFRKNLFAGRDNEKFFDFGSEDVFDFEMK